MDLTEQQQAAQAAFREFVDREIAPRADSFDREQRLPASLIKILAEKQYLAATLPAEIGGGGYDLITYGLLNEEMARGCSSVRSLITVHCMVAQAIQKWGNPQLKENWLPKMATGELIAGFGLSEPNVGSDAASVETTAEPHGDHYLLHGVKKWITFGQIANVFLVIARCAGRPMAFLLSANDPQLTREPIEGLLGVRASMLATLRLNGCRVPNEQVVGKPGFGFSPVATTALEHGRYAVAWSCVGIAQACLEASAAYAAQRKQFGSHLKDFDLIKRMIAEMICNIKAARLLCLRAGYLKRRNHPDAFAETNIAKYFASRMASRCASDAVQIHGAIGCSAASSVQRYYRDAKIMEIIEGSTQIQQIAIADYGLRDFS